LNLLKNSVSVECGCQPHV